MLLKWMGAALVVAGSASVGFKMASGHRAREQELRRLLAALDYMAWELEFRLTALPELCRQAGREAGGQVGRILAGLCEELEQQHAPDAQGCMHAVLDRQDRLSDSLREGMLLLGQSLGRFDLQGQLSGLEAVRSHCRRELEQLTDNRDSRLRSYQTLGLCAGAALAILFV